MPMPPRRTNVYYTNVPRPATSCWTLAAMPAGTRITAYIIGELAV